MQRGFKGDPQGAEEVTVGESRGGTGKNALSHSWHARVIVAG